MDRIGVVGKFLGDIPISRNTKRRIVFMFGLEWKGGSWFTCV